MRREWLKKPIIRIRPKLPPKRWMRIAKRRLKGKVKAVRASRLPEAREAKGNSPRDALQKILRMEMESPIPPKVVVEKAIFPREKASQVANS